MNGETRPRLNPVTLLRSMWYAAIRAASWLRLRFLPLSLLQAEQWSDYIRFRPRIFGYCEYEKVVTLPNGVRFFAGIVDHIERHIRLTKHWDKTVEYAISAHLKPGDTFLDIGANIGYFSLFASAIVGDAGRVVSVEPSLRAIAKFAKNVSLNKVSNITLLSVAAGERPSTETLALAHSKNIGGSSIKLTEHREPSESIICMPLGPILRDIGASPAVIKIDVEGFELFALRGVIPHLEKLPVIVLELSPSLLKKTGHSAREVVEYLAHAGYTAEVLSDSATGIVRTALQSNTDFENMPQSEVLFLPNP